MLLPHGTGRCARRPGNVPRGGSGGALPHETLTTTLLRGREVALIVRQWFGSVPGRHQPIEVHTMKTKPAGRPRTTVAALLITAFTALGLSGTSHAGCVPTKLSEALKARPSAAMNVGAGDFVRVSDSDSARTIVGLWKFEMISKSTPTHTNPMPDGTLIDFGTAAWHADGTEIQMSGIRDPRDGDVCQGVWRQVGDGTFVLNHVALAWTNGTYTGPVSIRAEVTVDRSGRRYSGMFATIVYLAAPVAGHEFDQNTVLASITGTFTATRVTQR